MNRASDAQIAQVEEHLLVCERCQEALLDVTDFVAAMQVGLEQLEGLIANHRTEDGPILLSVHEQDDQWVARIRGESIDSGSTVSSRDEGVEYCKTTFAELFPNHVCTPECRILPPSRPGL